MKVKQTLQLRGVPADTQMIVSQLRRLDDALVLLFMAAFNLTRLHSAFQWCGRNACLLWRCAKRALVLIGPYVFPLHRLARSGGPSELERSGGPGELERSGGPGELEGNAGDPPEVEESRPEGQHEAAAAAAGKRTADSDRDFALKRPRFEEEEGEFDGEEYRVDPTDDLYCDYDSTWEAEEPQWGAHPRPRRPAARNFKFGRYESAARDMQNYRHGYPNSSQYQIRRQQRLNRVSDDKPNLQFYLGKKCSEPDGVYINSFHHEWFGDYSSLESVHSYIQWLFPLQEPGMNSEARTLTKAEIQEFCQNDAAKANLLTSYKLMLDFYGIELRDEKTGEVTRASNWKDRFHNLNCRTHNNLRITRILKCLGTLGYPHYQAPLVHFFLEETLVHGELPAVKDSVLSYFLFAVLDKKERRRLLKFAYSSYSRKEEFVWCPGKIQRMWSRGVQGRNELNPNPLSQYSEDEET
ncbi:opioid growth factor receptor-like [Cyclopterus lumpus]|uniref:opioid growth factor receptor-like n=1 Tax=Cyclopterus lumpus TaxID=8103 RepID=UPI001486AE7D|nr:opioid growth factor receptor-like [Cyclopterus lumpus]